MAKGGEPVFIKWRVLSIKHHLVQQKYDITSTRGHYLPNRMMIIQSVFIINYPNYLRYVINIICCIDISSGQVGLKIYVK